MIRELLIFVYLFTFRLLFQFFKLFPVQNKVVYVTSFLENNINIYNEQKRQDYTCRTIFLTRKDFINHLKQYKDDHTDIILFNLRSPYQFIKGIFHLATSRVILVDNYFGFLSAIKFKQDVTCIQLWHANGAIKKFGLLDPGNNTRTLTAMNRFQKVYNQFHKIIVGSDKMQEIFKKAFGLDDSRFIKSGIPRTDIFYNHELIEEKKEKLYNKFPHLQGKKILLYAPTYRNEDLENFELNLDLELMTTELATRGYILLLKLHPAIKQGVEIPNNCSHFVYDFSKISNTNDLLFITDILITDYSSLPFEFSILEKPMIFYPYDFDDYKNERGFWDDYHQLVPGPVVLSTAKIISLITESKFNIGKVKEFKQEWNQYSNGNSSKEIARYIHSLINNKNL
ncbi:CDP-glycerol glycerophosphotransferase family protein [Cytobacillus kochii]|uniref:CDP-glycerol--glycerophosphate glycerophosphotransferase n=1 Tax=Cytobacillus kochii TaxID=859143 RepID=A0A248TJC8_9BACI|nr:CDP-glycerol glycerophosphotransferase family protein [Cytobacillus kochii]ASV68239.1 hypothetical protein CKF48_13440 [Cytobacillus kochii]